MAAVAQAPPAPLHTGPSGPRPTSSHKSVEPRRESNGSSVKEETKDASSPKNSRKPIDLADDANGEQHHQRPPIRPNAAKSTRLDLEPNPFEQSFSRSSHHSSSSLSDRGTTPPRGGEATSTRHNALPPLSSLTSPAAADPSQFPWLANQSLRTGPLSPAMLAGPQQHNGATNANGQQREGANGHSHGEAFDGQTFRTGFTPGTGSGFTPGYSSLMAGNFASSLPLPSPNTAAFLNMVTNATPIGEGDQAQNENQPPQSADHPEHPPSAIPPHMQPHQNPQHPPGPPQHGLSHLQSNPNISQETITPNTLSALTGVFNDMNRNQSQPPPNYFQPMGPPGPPPHGMHPHPHHPGQPPHGHPGMPHVDYAQQSANAASQAANGLFLLSQAHQELSKREEETRPVGGKRGSTGGPAAAKGQKRKSDAANGPGGMGVPGGKAPKKGKKLESPIKDESTSPNFSDDDDEGMSKSGKPETEEEKRKNFLERNRQAALKCRQRKKAWLGELQTKVESLQMDNDRLQQTIASLHDEVGRLSSILMQHRDCGLGIPTGYGRPIR